MSRKRKGNKKRRGGRVTPPGGHRAPSGGLDPASGFPVRSGDGWTPSGSTHLVQPEAPSKSDQPNVHEVFSAMAEQLGQQRDGHPAEIEELASGFVSILALAAAESDDEVGGSPSPDDRTQALKMLGVAVTLLAEAERIHPQPNYIDCLRALEPFVDGNAAEELRMAVDRADGRSLAPAWADAVWKAAPVGAWRAGDLLGDSLNLGIELAWPGGFENRVLFGSLIITEGPFVNDLVLATLDEFTEVYTPGTGHPVGPDGRPYLADAIRFLEPADVAKVARDLAQGMAIAFSDPDAPLQPGFDALAPLAGLLLGRLRAAPPEEPTHIDEHERSGAVAAFLDSPEAAGLADAQPPATHAQVGQLCDRCFDYAEARAGGDPFRWSPLAVAAFVDWYHHTEIVSDEDDERLRRILDAWIRYCHRRKGWPASITDEALLRLETQLNEAADPTELWEQSLNDGLERMADELGFELPDEA
ncbi:MAG: hypothetical protein R2754_11725 [Microthrixaceae bacterium]